MSAVVLCDFDGTITAEETFFGTFASFVPGVAERVLPALYARELSVRSATEKLVAALEPERLEDFIASVDEVPLREGFDEFLSFLSKREIPLVVVSGGLEVMIRRALGPRVEQVRAIHAVRIERDGPGAGGKLRPISELMDEREVVAKARVAARYGDSHRISIGDSITDLALARVVEQVFARDRLASYLGAEGRPFTPFETFGEIEAAMRVE